jgi:hypothetical protein
MGLLKIQQAAETDLVDPHLEECSRERLKKYGSAKPSKSGSRV